METATLDSAAAGVTSAAAAVAVAGGATAVPLNGAATVAADSVAVACTEDAAMFAEGAELQLQASIVATSVKGSSAIVFTMHHPTG
jgi:hypothetical protein